MKSTASISLLLIRFPFQYIRTSSSHQKGILLYRKKSCFLKIGVDFTNVFARIFRARLSYKCLFSSYFLQKKTCEKPRWNWPQMKHFFPSDIKLVRISKQTRTNSEFGRKCRIRNLTLIYKLIFNQIGSRIWPTNLTKIGWIWHKCSSKHTKWHVVSRKQHIWTK